MLTKPAIVTEFPAVPAQEYIPASYTCYSTAPPGTNGDGTAFPTPPSGSVVPEAGTQIVLEYLNGDAEVSVAPAPAGFTCEYVTGTFIIVDPTDPFSTVTLINPVVCTEQ